MTACAPRRSSREEQLQLLDAHPLGLLLVGAARAERAPDEGGLLLLQLHDALLDRVAHQEVLDAHRVELADPVDAVDGLLLDGGVPPRVEQVDRLRPNEVEADAARLA